MNAAGVARALGGARREGRDWRCRCPVHSGRSLTLADGRYGLLIRCWAGCPTRDVLAELRRMSLLSGRSDAMRSTLPATIHRSGRADAVRRIAVAHCVWKAARDARGTPVARYLKGRGITIAPARLVALGAALLAPGGTRRPAGDGGARRRAGRRAARHSPDLD